jgi:hypothetical protein
MVRLTPPVRDELEAIAGQKRRSVSAVISSVVTDFSANATVAAGWTPPRRQ